MSVLGPVAAKVGQLDILVTMYPAASERHDVIETRSCVSRPFRLGVDGQQTQPAKPLITFEDNGSVDILDVVFEESQPAAKPSSL